MPTVMTTVATRLHIVERTRAELGPLGAEHARNPDSDRARQRRSGEGECHECSTFRPATRYGSRAMRSAPGRRRRGTRRCPG